MAMVVNVVVKRRG